MSVTINVFRSKGDGKRGSPVTNAEFSQLLQQPKLAPGFPGATQIVPLTIAAQTGGQYVLSPAPDPFQSSAYTLQVGAPDVAGTTQMGIRDGEVGEARVGYER
jgi:hypothetical protein